MLSAEIQKVLQRLDTVGRARLIEIVADHLLQVHTADEFMAEFESLCRVLKYHNLISDLIDKITDEEEESQKRRQPKWKVGDWADYMGNKYQITKIYNDCCDLKHDEGSCRNILLTDLKRLHGWRVGDMAKLGAMTVEIVAVNGDMVVVGFNGKRWQPNLLDLKPV